MGGVSSHTINIMKNTNDLHKHIKIKPLIVAFTVIYLASVAIASNFRNAPDIENTIRIIQPNSAPSVNRLIDLAKTDHLQLLEWSMSMYGENVHDYSAILHKQERINGKLRDPQDIAFWFKEKPYSLYMEWENNNN